MSESVGKLRRDLPLLPCPHCGGVVYKKIERTDGDGDFEDYDYARIVCNKCGVLMHDSDTPWTHNIERKFNTRMADSNPLLVVVERIINQTAYYNLVGMSPKQKDDLLAKIFDWCQEAHGDKR
jgi:transcription initiation factor TFIIIB Brf1 subunit/transcription initiation factor TFIIB